MFFLLPYGRRGSGRRQPGVLGALALACAGLASCENSQAHMPIDWWHDLQGGAIAADRPAPPGADLPYPTLGPMPAKPTPPDKTARAALLDQLAAERDRAQRLAARNPIAVLPPSAPPPPPKPPSATDQTANASLPAADAPPPALLKPAPSPAGPSPVPTGPVLLAGDGIDATTLPPIPDTPPAPASFEGIPAEPLPTPPPPVPSRLPSALRGQQVLFPSGQATLLPSQNQTLKDAAAHRKGHMLEINGHGEATADTPEAQEAAIDLGLKRAQAVAMALTTQQHVPNSALRLNADAFGRGADIRILP